VTSTLASAKSRSARSFGTGLVLILVGVVLSRSPFILLAPILVGTGVYIAASAFTRLARLVAKEGIFRATWSLHERFARSSLPRKVFWLLLAIAEVDGRAEAKEHEIVRRFLMERFADPVTVQDLDSWAAQRIPTDQVGQLTQRLRIILSQAECETVFYWGCLVAFADGNFNPDEHRVLQIVARAFGFPPDHARRIFHHAKQRYMAGGEPGPGTIPRSSADERTLAFETLGLQSNATDEQIRSRHRELAKVHHPDAHAHLGPVAAREATDRFREIQTAYELLANGR
jgi:DnaJ-domain-containing protein 1